MCDDKILCEDNILCDLVQSESEVRLFGEKISLSAGKGKGSGTAVVKSDG